MLQQLRRDNKLQLSSSYQTGRNKKKRTKFLQTGVLSKHAFNLLAIPRSRNSIYFVQWISCANCTVRAHWQLICAEETRFQCLHAKYEADNDLSDFLFRLVESRIRTSTKHSSHAKFGGDIEMCCNLMQPAGYKLLLLTTVPAAKARFLKDD